MAERGVMCLSYSSDRQMLLSLRPRRDELRKIMVTNREWGSSYAFARCKWWMRRRPMIKPGDNQPSESVAWV
jgi:hypothetical protein